MAEETVRVQYVGNADPRNSNEQINAASGSIPIGGMGELTLTELANLRSFGLVIDILGEDSAAKDPVGHSHGVGQEPHDHPINFDAMSGATLETLVDLHELAVEGTGAGGNVVKGDLVEALQAAH